MNLKIQEKYSGYALQYFFEYIYYLFEFITILLKDLYSNLRIPDYDS